MEGITQLCRTSKLSINAKDKDNYCMNKPEKIRKVWDHCRFLCYSSFVNQCTNYLYSCTLNQGNILIYIYNFLHLIWLLYTGTCDLPYMYAFSPWASGIHTYQANHSCSCYNYCMYPKIFLCDLDLGTIEIMIASYIAN